MLLSLDIMKTAEALAVYGAGATRDTPIGKGCPARPGSKNRAKVQDGSPRNLRDPKEGPACRRKGQPAKQTPGSRSRSQSAGTPRRTRNGEQRWGLGSETISDRVRALGSLSAFIVPRTSGNSASEDPTEEREAPRGQSRRWETRRVH